MFVAFVYFRYRFLVFLGQLAPKSALIPSQRFCSFTGCLSTWLALWHSDLCGGYFCLGFSRVPESLSSFGNFVSGFLAPIYEKVLECNDEKACMLLEMFLIRSIGRDDLGIDCLRICGFFGGFFGHGEW